jgi:hypothetical protein
VSTGPSPGLCGECRHARTLTSSGGATYYQCLLAETDPRFPKWPRLPVLSCSGYEPGEGEALA